jgi:hypothetical protein
MKMSKDYNWREDNLFQDNNTRALYYKIADNLPGLVKMMEIAAERGSEMAKKELPMYKKMLELFNTSKLGKYF